MSPINREKLFPAHYGKKNFIILIRHEHIVFHEASGSALGRDYTYILKNKGSINSSCRESLFEDFQKQSPTSTGDILDRRWPANTIQELTNNDAIIDDSSKGGLSGDLKPRHSFINDIRNLQIVMITHNMDILQWILEKITYIKQRVLTIGISIIIEYHTELSVTVQETLSMRNRTFNPQVKRQAKYLLSLKGEMRKIHTVHQELKGTILINITILKIRNHQEEYGGIRTITLRQYHVVIKSLYHQISVIGYLYVLLKVSEYGQPFDGITVVVVGRIIRKEAPFYEGPGSLRNAADLISYMDASSLNPNTSPRIKVWENSGVFKGTDQETSGGISIRAKMEEDEGADTYYKHSHIGWINRKICNRE
ncbi:hypothetical protein C922_05487 [Plasmodium inui San Antonio 1]|uniref:Uncharacterized protein n=1 Tax=Plasmodium inui San Antonio 1 TaxID=1237626 RepID=W6ZXU6_9APIC|nr:hypothetical protein C922_05487 [Plasmodium inui San Antonio 1]EUD64128.1 hypothetical protein C922_05487 [Plasmodium inui San Antonio 1]